LLGAEHTTEGQFASSAGITHLPLPAWHCMQVPLQALSQHTPSTHKPVPQGVPVGLHTAPRLSRHWPFTNCCPLGQLQLPAWQTRPPVHVSQHWLLAMQRPSPQLLVPAGQPQPVPVNTSLEFAHTHEPSAPQTRPVAAQLGVQQR
jgi:hypothetical protein